MLERGEITPVKQDESLAGYVKMMDKSRGKIDWTSDAASIERLVRGLNPWPSAYTSCQGKTVKIWRSDAVAAVEAAIDRAIAEVGPKGMYLDSSVIAQPDEQVCKSVL